MTTLIFDPVLTGHHLEYLHHIYEAAAKETDRQFVFAVPHDEWTRMRDKFEWPKAPNIRMHYLDDAECRRSTAGSLLVQSWRTSRLIKRTAKVVGADKIFMISLAPAIPFLPLMFGSKVKVSGIIYKIYLRAPKKGLRGLLDKVRYTIMARCPSVAEVLILNDPRSAEALNRIYRSNKFVSLADPVPQVDKSRLRDLREELGIPAGDKVFLHFGAMSARKGTLEILQSIQLMSADELVGKTFIFAGRVGNDIKDNFYRMAHESEARGASLIIYDEFCDYDFLNSLSYTADCILIPYIATNLSSGALGYAAVFNKPVIGPSSGLIGELILDNCLGQTLCSVDAKNLADAISSTPPKIHPSNYTQLNSIERFIASVIN